MSQSRATSASAGATLSTQSEARQRIIQAAFRLFGERGYSCTSIQDIADAADVQKSVLYYYFSSKEGLYQTLCSESCNNLRVFLLQALSEAGFPLASEPKDGWRIPFPADVSCETLLSALIETLIALARGNREPVRFFMAHIFAPDGDRPAANALEMEQFTPQLISYIGREGLARGELQGNIADLERLLLGAVHYAIIRHLRAPSEEPLAEGLGCRIVRAALQGFRASNDKQNQAKSGERRPPNKGRRRLDLVRTGK